MKTKIRVAVLCLAALVVILYAVCKFLSCHIIHSCN